MPLDTRARIALARIVALAQHQKGVVEADTLAQGDEQAYSI